MALIANASGPLIDAVLPRLASGRPRIAYHLLRFSGESPDWSEIVERAGLAEVALVTVDVFDTVLHRRLVGDGALELAISQAVAASGGWSGTAQSYATARRSAVTENPSACLAELYESSALSSGVIDADACLRAEFELERRLVRPVPGAADALVAVRASGKQVLFLSDMHLPSALISEFLLDSGLMTASDEIVVSCEAGSSKAGGELFAQIARDRDLPLSSLLHIGNSLWSDGAQAAASGARSMVTQWAEPTMREQWLADLVGTSGPLIAGAARTARLELDRRHPDSTAAEIGVSVVGPLMTAFVLWIRQRALSCGARHVVFLARDGELPYRIAKAMPDRYWEGLELSYVHGNRETLMLAGAHVTGIDAWLEIWAGQSESYLQRSRVSRPFEETLRLMGLSLDDLPPDHLARSLDPSKPIGVNDDDCWIALTGDARVRAIIEARSAEQHELVSEYLAQIGLQNGKSVVVDIGWRGQLGVSIDTLLEPLSGHHPLNLHFGGSGVSSVIDSLAEFERFAFDDSVAAPPMLDVVMSIESFSSSGSERAIGYQRNESGGVEVRFSPAEPGVWNAQRACLWDAAVEVGRLLPEPEELAEFGCIDFDIGEAAAQLLTLLWLLPTEQEALVGTRLQIRVDGEVSPIPLASRYRVSELTGQRPDVPRLWRAASLRLTPRPFRMLLRIYFSAQDR